MKNWQETGLVFAQLESLGRTGGRAALAVITAIQGSTYRRPGAKLLVEAERAMWGNVSGGCLEEDLREVARDVLRLGLSRCAHYDTSDDEDVAWGLGLGCNGEVDLLITPVLPQLPLAAIRDILSLLQGNEAFALCFRLTEGRPLGLATVVTKGGPGWSDEDAARCAGAATEALARGASGTMELAGERCFLDVLTPPPHLVLCGAGDDAQPLARMGAQAGFRVTVVDHRPAYLAPSRFPGAHALYRWRPEDGLGDLPVSRDTYVVLKTHTVRYDRGWLEAFLSTEVPYIGLLGPKARRDDLLGGVAEAARLRLFGPVGLDLGGEGAEQVALSVLAEILAVRSGRSPGHLRDRSGPIHPL